MGMAIVKDGNGYPLIAYQSVAVSSAPAVVKVARPGSAIAALPGKTNCGPQNPFFSWYCEVVDRGNSWVDEGMGVAVDVNSAGLAKIAYRELNKYLLPAKGNLKVAYQGLPVFLPLVAKGK